MTCPDRPHDLDLLLAGEPVPETVRQHAATCEACAEEAALDAQITAAFAARRSTVAPAGLVAAALAEARREAETPTRPSRRSVAASRPAIHSAQPRRLHMAAIAVLAAFVLAMAWVLRPSDTTPSTAPLTAETQEAPSTPEPADPEPAELATVTDEPETSPETVAPASTPRRAAPRRTTPRRTPSPVPPLPDSPPPPVDLAQNDRQPEEAEPSPEEVAQAEADLKLAFALVGDAQNRARRAVRASTDALDPALDHAFPF